jgi:hypothetical protein
MDSSRRLILTYLFPAGLHEAMVAARLPIGSSYVRAHAPRFRPGAPTRCGASTRVQTAAPIPTVEEGKRRLAATGPDPWSSPEAIEALALQLHSLLKVRLSRRCLMTPSPE